jgi:hypothetical protein
MWERDNYKNGFLIVGYLLFFLFLFSEDSDRSIQRGRNQRKSIVRPSDLSDFTFMSIRNSLKREDEKRKRTIRKDKNKQNRLAKSYRESRPIFHHFHLQLISSSDSEIDSGIIERNSSDSTATN